MRLIHNAGRRIASAVLAIGMLAVAALAQADPPIRAARLSYLQGPVSFAPAGDNTWVEARLNRPITIGDSLWTDNAARTELQFGVDGPTRRIHQWQLLNLDDRTIQLQLAQGRVNVHARMLRNDEVVEVATPNLAFTIRQAGDYRIEVDSRADATTVSVRNGAAEVYGEGAAVTRRANDVARSYGRDLRASEFYSLAPVDEFDRWSFDRDRRSERAISARYVSPEVIGYADLDQYGSWDDAGGYGNAWFPRDVPREWAPYRYGHWSWIDPWGWTWVDDAPWGFAPFHYGRWAIFGARWGWVPGPINVRPVYAPALVAFIGGSNFSLSISSGPAGGQAGSRWHPVRFIARLQREPRLCAQRQRQQHDRQHDRDQQHLQQPGERDAGKFSQRAGSECGDRCRADRVRAIATGTTEHGAGDAGTCQAWPGDERRRCCADSYGHAGWIADDQSPAFRGNRAA
jgi:hypothetical protein